MSVLMKTSPVVWNTEAFKTVWKCKVPHNTFQIYMSLKELTLDTSSLLSFHEVKHSHSRKHACMGSEK